MKISRGLIYGCLAVLFLMGGLMAESHTTEKWMTIEDREAGLRADFPQRPLDIIFDIPFQNTPATGHLHVYSVPTKTGVLILSTLTSPSVTTKMLEKEQLKQYFETVLVPHLFYSPKIFQDRQTFKYTSKEVEGHPAASFLFTYQDHDQQKRLEGFAFVKEHNLYTYFYLASEQNFDQNLLNRFVSSIHLIDN